MQNNSNDYSIEVEQNKTSNPRAEQDSLRLDRELRPSDLLTRTQVCTLLHISLPTLHRAVRLGVLKARKFGRRTLFRVSDIEKVLTSN